MGYLWLQATLAALRGVDPFEVMQALGAKQRWPVPGIAPQGLRVLMIRARTNTGRPLVVALRQVSDTAMDWWIIGARQMTAAEQAAFEQWEADQ